MKMPGQFLPKINTLRFFFVAVPLSPLAVPPSAEDIIEIGRDLIAGKDGLQRLSHSLNPPHPPGIRVATSFVATGNPSC